MQKITLISNLFYSVAVWKWFRWKESTKQMLNLNSYCLLWVRSAKDKWFCRRPVENSVSFLKIGNISSKEKLNILILSNWHFWYFVNIAEIDDCAVQMPQSIKSIKMSFYECWGCISICIWDFGNSFPFH